jgi:hypothetical protein
MIPFAIVQQAHDAGLAVLPPEQDGSKRPYSPWLNDEGKPTWNPAKVTRPNLTLLSEWYDPTNGRTGIGVVCGKVSGNLEVIDFDTREGWQDYRELADACGFAELVDRVWSGYGEESPRGAHLIYRCAEIGRNTKLAKKRGHKEAFIETRGEGGYVIIAPSGGPVHPSGQEYRRVSGSLETIVTLTPEERRDLMELAKSMDETERPLNRSEPLQSSQDPANKPGADFNQRATWSEVLEPHGWRPVMTKGNVTYWRRPNKTRGVSATTGYNGTDYLYVFTTSTGLDSERAYTKFGAYGVLNHRGDFRAATAALGQAGYGPPPCAPRPRPQLRVVASNPQPDAVNEEPARAEDAPLWQETLDAADADLPADCLTLPFGCGPELLDWIMATNLHPNPVFAIQTARSFLAAALSRRHVSSMRNFTSLYAVLIGKTASGKEDAKHQIETLLTECDLARLIGGKGYSHPSAIYTALQDEPKHLTLIDEIGLYLREQKNSSSNINLLLREYMELFGRAHGLHHAPRLSGLGIAKAEREAVKKDRAPIIKPGLNLLAISTPETLWASLSRDHLDSGFLNRFLLIESRAPRTPIRPFLPLPVPDSVKTFIHQATGQDNPLSMAQQFIYDLEPPLEYWPLTDHAMRAMQAFEQKMLDWAEAWDRRLPGLGNLTLRANEQALRLAVQNAVLDNRDDHRLHEVHLIHAQLYVEAHLQRGGESVYRYMIASPFEANRNLVLEALRKAGDLGVTDREMRRNPPFTRFTQKELNELLTSLQTGYLIDHLNTRSGKPGKRREAWVALDPDATAQYCDEPLAAPV